MPNRPPKRWMRRCVRKVRASKSASNPGAVCGSLWYHKMSPAAKRKAMRADEGIMRYRGITIDKTAGGYYARLGQGMRSRSLSSLKARIDRTLAVRNRNRRAHRRGRLRNPVALSTYAPLANPVSPDAQVAIAVFALAAAGLGVWWYMNRYTLTVAPGSQSLKVPAGKQFTLLLPSGAQWQSIAAGAPTAMPTAAAASGNGPMQMTASSGETVLASWVDKNSATQLSTITITA